MEIEYSDKIPQERELTQEEIEYYTKKVMNGVFGNDEERKKQLGNKYNIIQSNVNLRMENNFRGIRNWRENEVDNKAEFSRINNLSSEEMRTSFGYLFPLIQCKRNENEGKNIMFNIEEKDIENLAREVKLGRFGDGIERKHKLGGLCEIVQKKVNEILKMEVKLKLKESAK